MSAAILDGPAAVIPARSGGDRSRRLAAAGVALAVHAAVLALLTLAWRDEPPLAPQVRTLTTRLVALAPASAPLPEQPVAARPPGPVAAPEPHAARQKPERAALARKRLEMEKRERQRVERQRVQERHEQARREAEALARREAEAAERAATERARVAQAAATAERARVAQAAATAERARAEAAEAASSQYLPIAKRAPDYPESALDRGIEGDCTVGYRVDAQGRVEEPRIVGDCHPLFVRPSLAAARTFRYRPRIVDGRAVVVPDVKNTFHYRIREKRR
ncbi:energy transducer TonB [Azotobacter vinelandii]|uniref:energy transducer TonB n=1 Tax=Azotobacter vinelandii TaxID=354 RepID=UPI00090EC623|nr:energy transducer TonB [Azotobacter vinelandii]SFX81434.1 outer membrane transport energization protein TonB [Azotobacter vinelandii]